MVLAIPFLQQSVCVLAEKTSPLAALLPILGRQRWPPYLVREQADATPAASMLPIPGLLRWEPDPHPFRASEAAVEAAPARLAQIVGGLPHPAGWRQVSDQVHQILRCARHPPEALLAQNQLADQRREPPPPGYPHGSSLLMVCGGSLR